MSKPYYLGVDNIETIYESSCGLPEHLQGIQVKFHGQYTYFPCDRYEIFKPEECRKQAHDEAWELAKNIREMLSDERKECFGHVLLPPVFDLGYEKAKAMYDKWVKKNTVKEMTVEEVSQALGYKVKIVSKED